MIEKIILVTGGTDGLGKAIVEKLAKHEHFKIISFSRNIPTEKIPNVDYVIADISNSEIIESAVEQLLNKYKKIDCLINNAGIISERPFVKEEYSTIKKIIDINTIGTMYVTRACLPKMYELNSGQIINIVSLGGLSVSTLKPVYNTSKWAITGFTKCLEEDAIKHGIKVTGIYPGTIKTNIFEKNNIENDLTRAIEPNDIALIVENLITSKSTFYVSDISLKFYH